MTRNWIRFCGEFLQGLGQRLIDYAGRPVPMNSSERLHRLRLLQQRKNTIVKFERGEAR